MNIPPRSGPAPAVALHHYNDTPLPDFCGPTEEHQKVWGSGVKRPSIGHPPIAVVNLVTSTAPHFLMLSYYEDEILAIGQLPF